MQIKVPLTVAALALILIVSVASCVEALSVGVKRGDWIEYSVSYTGTPMRGHDIDWARMEILDVADTEIPITITSRFSNGSTETASYTLNLLTGHLIDSFIIPANLNLGDNFLDENLGTVTISKVETRQYAGAMRAVVSATVGNNSYVWDQATGVSVEGNSQTADYTIHTLASETNMWQSSPLNLPSLALLAAVVLVLVFAVVAVFVYARRRRACAKRKKGS